MDKDQGNVPIAAALEDLESLDTAELVAFVDSQASIIDLLAADASVEDVLLGVVTQMEEQWADATVAILWPVDDHNSAVLSRRTLSNDLTRVLQERQIESGIDEKAARDHQAVRIPILGDPLANIAWVVPIVTPIGVGRAALAAFVSTEAERLEDGWHAVLLRHARFAQLAIERHISELALQRLIAEERQALAGVIHDDPIQAITAVSLRLQRLSRHVDEEGAEIFADVQRSVTMAIDRMRKLLIDLHPPTLDSEGLVSAIDVYFAEVLEPLGLDCVLVDELVDEPPIGTASLAYRLATEALWNVAKHAEAAVVTVTLRGDNGAVEVVVVDDGVGFDAGRSHRRRAGHMGLSACRELATRASGSWVVESLPGAGTTVTMVLPGPVAVESVAIESLAANE